MSFIAVFHLGAGGALMLSSDAQKILADLYGAQVQWTDDTIYLIRVLGSFAFALGILALLAAINPVRNQVVGWGFVTLFLLRDFQRHYYYSELESGFAVSAGTNLLTTLFFLGQAVLLVILLFKLPRREDLRDM
jgi:hypothetical protein